CVEPASSTPSPSTMQRLAIAIAAAGSAAKRVRPMKSTTALVAVAESVISALTSARIGLRIGGDGTGDGGVVVDRVESVIRDQIEPHVRSSASIARTRHVLVLDTREHFLDRVV